MDRGRGALLWTPTPLLACPMMLPWARACSPWMLLLREVDLRGMGAVLLGTGELWGLVGMLRWTWGARLLCWVDPRGLRDQRV